MAEFALGLTKSAVEGTLSRVKSAIEEEDKQRVRVQDDLVFITGEFEMMQSFLGVANAERANNPVVRTWVKQLRDLAFDVEDCVEFVIHLDKPSRWDWVRRFASSVICIARPPLPLDVAVADIKRLKTRVEDVSQRNTRYNLISDSGSSSSSNSAVTIVSTPAVELKPTSTASLFHTLCEVWEEAGRKRRGTDDLKKLIMREGRDLEVISLWGSQEVAHLGTTHVIREAYNDPQIRQEFSIRARVKLLHPFNLEEFLKSLRTQFNLAASAHRQRSSGRSHIQTQATDIVCETDHQLMQHLMEHRYLVILEDVCTAAEWDDIREYLPDTKNGSRIVVSAQQLGLAISCLRRSCQVAELRKFSHGQSLCAFINKVPDCRSDMSEFCWQLRCGGVISVWGHRKSTTIIDSVYTSITHKSKAFDNDGVEFEKHSWVEVPSPFILDVFSRRLLLSFHGDDFVAQDVAAVGRMGHQGVVQRCHRFLREYKCLVVINGLKNNNDWDSIKSTFLTVPVNGCILVITHPSVRDSGVPARYCVDHKEDRAINIQYLESDSMLRHLIKSSRVYGIGGKEACRRGRLFSNRREEARIWTKQFGHVVPEKKHSTLQFNLQWSGGFSLWGTDGAGKSAIVRKAYYYQLLLHHNDNIFRSNPGYDIYKLPLAKLSWVDVPHPFNLMDFAWRLLLDFHSDDLQAKETVAVSMMEGQDDPIEGCLKFIGEGSCFIVINGLRSTDDWDSIRDAFSWSEASKNYIVIITNEESVATHCIGSGKYEKFNVKGVEAEPALRWLTKDCGYYGNGSAEASHFFSNRREEAVDWALTSELASELFQYDVRSFYTHVGLLSISGISGVGKSVLGKYIYYKMMFNSEESSTRFTSFSWVNVPQPFNLMEFCWQLLLDFHSDDLEAKETAIIGMIDCPRDQIEECREFLHKECFVVIDGLCSTHDWDLIRDALSPEITQGCILVIANETNVATYCIPDKRQMLSTMCLEPNAALLLFEKVISCGMQLSPRKIELSKLIMAKCGGLPKVIVAIGEHYIASRMDIQILENLNINFMGTLETMPEFCSLRGLFGWMQSYFDACSDALKPCIFYLSVFPVVNIRRGRLLRRWIAEGYSRAKFGITAEKDGEILFHELVQLSIIQEPPGHTGYRRSLFSDPGSKVDNVFQVNGFFHEYIISRQLEDNLVFALEGHCDLNSQRVGQHLTIRSSWDRDEIVFKSMDLSRLRSLTVFGEWRSFFISTAADSINMRLLRVLDLEDTTSGVTNDVLEQIGKLLPRLKFLSVRGCQDITCMPDSLGCLRQLQTLDVSHTKITTLPCAIINLVKLQYLCAGTTLEPLDQDRENTSNALRRWRRKRLYAGTTLEPLDQDRENTSSALRQWRRKRLCAGTTLEPLDQDRENRSSTLTQWRRKTRALVQSYSCSWSSKKKNKQFDNGSSVDIPTVGLGNLTVLHSLGIVNVSGAGGNAILKEMKKLTQLHNLWVSGINRKNWDSLCSVISGHGHLESLSVRLDYEYEQEGGLCCLDDISELPNTLKFFELYWGTVRASPPWILRHQLFQNMLCRDDHLDLLSYIELTMSTQEDIDSLKRLGNKSEFRYLCVKPIQDSELRYGWWDEDSMFLADFEGPVLKIECNSYKLALVFGPRLPKYVEKLEVHCSCTESFLKLSGLEELKNLEEVCLKGCYSDELRQYLQQKVDCLEAPSTSSTRAQDNRKPVLKLEPQQSAPSTPCASLKRLFI